MKRKRASVDGCVANGTGMDAGQQNMLVPVVVPFCDLIFTLLVTMPHA